MTLAGAGGILLARIGAGLTPESLWIRGEVTGSIVAPRSIRARRLLPPPVSSDIGK